MKNAILFIAINFFSHAENAENVDLFFFGFFRHGFLVAFAAERLVAFGFAENHEFVAGDGAVRILRQASAAHADGVYLGDVFGYCHKLGHRAERLAHEVHIEASDDNPNSLICKLLANVDEFVSEKLRLVDADYVAFVGIKEDLLCVFHRDGVQCVGVMRNNVFF